MRERPVVREHKGAGRVGIEPSDRDDAALVAYEADDGRPSVRVSGGGDDAGRLVEEEVGQRLRFDRAAVDLDAVASLYERGEARDLAVHSDAAGTNEVFRPATRCDSRSGEVGVETHVRVIIVPVPTYISLMNWTSQGIGGLPAWRDRVDESERAIAARGGRLIDMYVTLGRFDLVEIFEAPDDDVAYGILLDLARHGTVRTETLRAFTRDEAEKIVRES